ncbi:hypothetical protein [Azospirillum largimobile]
MRGMHSLDFRDFSPRFPLTQPLTPTPLPQGERGFLGVH